MPKPQLFKRNDVLKALGQAAQLVLGQVQLPKRGQSTKCLGQLLERVVGQGTVPKRLAERLLGECKRVRSVPCGKERLATDRLRTRIRD